MEIDESGVDVQREQTKGDTSTSELTARWRSEAQLLRQLGVEGHAIAAERYANELDEFWCRRELESLTLEQAAEESEYSKSALQKMVARGMVPNAGKKNAPRIYRCDLPRKPGRRSDSLNPGDIDLADQILNTRL